MEWRVPLADIDFDGEEENAVINVLRSKWLTMGAITQEFEEEFSSLLQAKYAFAVTNATAALHLACLVLGIGPGDEVITPSLSFVATSNAVLYTGAELRFADIIGPNDLTIDPEDIKRKISPRTKAIIVMHYGGYPCRMAPILEIAQQNNLAVIEDAAHCPGAQLSNKYLGTLGTLGCFSFFSNKNLSTGEGGMIVTNREDLADKIRLLRSHGMTTLTYERHKGHASSYDVMDLGYNYRIDEIRAAIGRVQLKKLHKNNALRKVWTELYRKLLEPENVGLPFIDSEGCPAYHLFPILLPPSIDRKLFMNRMKDSCIQTSIHYPPTHQFTYYQNRFGPCNLPITDQIADREVTLPLYPTMGEENVYKVVDAVKLALQKSY